MLLANLISVNITATIVLIIIIIYSLAFFTSALADGLSL